LRTTPAEHLCGDAFWEGDEYHLKVSGEMREASLFGENIVLRRSLETVYGTSALTLTDEFENEAFREEPLMLLYHINLGWPFLNEHTRFYIPTKKVTPRDSASEGHEDRYNQMEVPKDNEPEYVFIHDLKTDGEGNTEVIAVHMNIGLRIAWNVRNLPYFMQWKSIASGDYVVGLEPANSSVYGRPWHEERGTVHKLAPFAKEKNVLTFSVLNGEAEIDGAVSAFEKVYNN
ncbi:MAG: aldose 1-epimerase family protein, partial [Synergistaceae bacterium]|nr:aldose 1-epimerase family protein [Synergistaceae bacterium]